MKYLILLSGGIDSGVALARYAPDAAAIFINYQQNNLEAERAASRALAAHYNAAWVQLHVDPTLWHNATGLTGAGVEKKRSMNEIFSPHRPMSFVPGRNLVLLALASSYAQVHGYHHLVVGCHKDDHNYPDCHPQFYHLLNALHTQQKAQLTIVTPFIDSSKEAILAEGQKCSFPFEKTWSCYSMEKYPKQCGECDACKIRDYHLNNLN